MSLRNTRNGERMIVNQCDCLEAEENVLAWRPIHAFYHENGYFEVLAIDFFECLLSAIEKRRFELHNYSAKQRSNQIVIVVQR